MDNILELNQRAVHTYKITVEEVPDETEVRGSLMTAQTCPKMKGTKEWVVEELSKGEERGVKALQHWIQ
jgi:hypothetical protein